LEAGALGKAAVASAVGGIPDVIRDWESGLLAAPGDGASLEAVLRRALAEKDRRRAWGEALRHTVRERFSLARAEKAYRDLYAEFLPALRSAKPPARSAP
jgi:glycosyltransferase involved in cell wall biosynthesis